MTTTASQSTTQGSMALLSRLLLLSPPERTEAGLTSEVLNIARDRFEELATLANLNHVIVRGLGTFLEIAENAKDDTRADWARTALAGEQARIATAIRFLDEICAVFQEKGHDVAVIKSLDHWPDLGSDLDLYTNADSAVICRLMKCRFGAQIAPRSWGDRLAGKWNFMIPGLPEAVEIHMGRLGQTGEQVTIASRLARRTRVIPVAGYQFRVPSASDRIMISTLQRMYRHFYFRLCDVVDSAGLAESGSLNFEDLRSSAIDAGIWEGVATYLVIVSDYVKAHRGSGVDLPQFVLDAARFGGSAIYFQKDFLRIPILPQSARLYGRQLAGLVRKRELHNGARLSLLPWLATAAVVGQKITGSDKGIW
jgi:hypothetical protein